ncbi:glutathione S-transferase C-terminal-like protein [Vararia minispora EC-137]|uniref:Glutathione S-transferase C-terminal-like protein n=1 Tax=Vararia minispora EC-137 TaxID=1314806 RepID=A0ACB8QNX4_9AGAM|nr:glutathione S-transferase C-terminal-like protein [Vararia minispora EC-137]
MSVESITLYACKVELALVEAGAKYTRYEIDMIRKPEWYTKVHPLKKLPAIVYGGPTAPLEDPSPASAKLVESLVLLEFVADLFPALLPADPVSRARARLVMDAIASKLTPVLHDFGFEGDVSLDALFTACEAFQALLPPDGFAVGQWSITDAVVAPFLGRVDAMLRAGQGRYSPENGEKAYKELFQSERFARLQKYWKDLSSRESWKSTFDEKFIIDYQRPFVPTRA